MEKRINVKTVVLVGLLALGAKAASADSKLRTDNYSNKNMTVAIMIQHPTEGTVPGTAQFIATKNTTPGSFTRDERLLEKAPLRNYSVTYIKVRDGSGIPVLCTSPSGPSLSVTPAITSTTWIKLRIDASGASCSYGL